MKFLITESQLKKLIQESTKKYYINLDVKLPKQGRTTIKITPKEFEDKMKNVWDEYNADSMHPMKFSFDNFVNRLCRKGTECKDMDKVYQDLSKIKYADENLGVDGKIKQTDGIAYLQCYAGGDWENPILFYLYFDGSSFRAYIPTYGNSFNRSTMTALGNNDEKDTEFLKTQHIDGNGEPLMDIARNQVAYDADACLKDFKSRIKVKKKITEDIGDKKRLRNGNHITFTRVNPTRLATAFLNWLKKQNIQYSYKIAQTKSKYIEFSTETIDYFYRFSNHTKPSFYGTNNAIEITFDKDNEYILAVLVDLANDTDLRSVKDLIKIVDETERYNQIVSVNHDNTYKDITEQDFPAIYVYLPHDKTAEKEKYEEELKYKKWENEWTYIYRQYYQNAKDRLSQNFISSSGLRLRYGKWKAIEKGKYVSESDKINSNAEFQAFLDSKILSFDEWRYYNGIEYPILPKKINL